MIGSPAVALALFCRHPGLCSTSASLRVLLMIRAGSLYSLPAALARPSLQAGYLLLPFRLQRRDRVALFPEFPQKDSRFRSKRLDSLVAQFRSGPEWLPALVVKAIADRLPAPMVQSRFRSKRLDSLVEQVRSGPEWLPVLV